MPSTLEVCGNAKTTACEIFGISPTVRQPDAFNKADATVGASLLPRFGIKLPKSFFLSLGNLEDSVVLDVMTAPHSNKRYPYHNINKALLDSLLQAFIKP